MAEHFHIKGGQAYIIICPTGWNRFDLSGVSKWGQIPTVPIWTSGPGKLAFFSHYKIIAYQSNYYYILQLDFISLLLSFKGGTKTKFDTYSKFVSSWNYTVFNYLVYV